MKSAYELAMERLAKSDPSAGKPLTAEQKARLAEIDRVYQGKLAEREIFLKKQLNDALADGKADEYEKIFPQLSITSSSYLIIVTRGHRDDMRVLRWAVNTPAKYVAMIGSKRKVISVIHELEKEGTPREAFERVYAPMGFEIGAITPEEIAISVGAEMVALRRLPEGKWRSLSKSIFADEHLRAPYVLGALPAAVFAQR